jgi:hypothetical protein
MRRLTNGTDRCSLRAAALLTFLIALFAIPATAGAATGGGLKQLSGGAGCIVDEASTPSGCTNVRGMTDVGDMAVSPDGKTAYVPSRGRGALAVFSRGANGSLTQKPGALGCYTSDSTVATADNCTLVGAGLASVFAVAVSHDGKHVYAGGNGFPVHFLRNSSGDLTYVGTGLSIGGQITNITVSPDDKSVYTSNLNQPGGLIGVYQTVAGGSGLNYRECIASTSTGYGCVLVSNGYVDEPGDLLVTPDNKELILANGENTGTDYSSGSVVGFPRTTSGASVGDLATPTTASCINGSSLAGCQSRSGEFYQRGLSTISNTEIYVAGYYGIFRIKRNASTNALSPVTDAGGCASYDGSGFTCGILNSNSGRVFNHRDVVVTGDGKNVYSDNDNGTASTILSFSRASNGTVAAIPAPLRCLRIDAGSGCSSTLRGGSATNNLVAFGSNVYAAGGNRLFAFVRDRAPVCQNVGASTTNNSAVTVTMSCSDPDGDAITYQKVSDPARGTLAGIQGNHVSYGPQPGTTGTDSFRYRAVAAGVPSDPATAFVNVSNPPPPPPSGGGGGGGPAPLTVIGTTVTNNWLAFPKYTKATSLSVNNLPAGSRVLTQCKTKKKKQQKKGCPYKSRSVTTTFPRAKLNLVKPFKKKKLPVGTTVTITTTAPGFIGKRFRYTIRKRAVPKKSLLCVPPGGKPAKCV